MTALAPKRPTEIKRYVLDYAHELGVDCIAAFQLTVTSGGVTIVPAGQLVPNPPPSNPIQVGEKAIAVFIGGGGNGQTSALELQITTQSGQLLIRDFTLFTSNSLNATGSLPSSTTKGQLVNKAFVECGLPGYEFDATTSEQADALLGLDILMAELASPGENLDIGYNFPATFGASGMSDPSGVPDLAVNFVVGRLAESIAPGIGKSLSAATLHRMATSLRAIRATFARIPHMRPTRQTIRGAGAKPWSTWLPFTGSWPDDDPSTVANELGTGAGGVIGDGSGGIIGV